MSKITHVLFDLDGLLLDSETLYTAAFTAIVEKYGKLFTWDLKKKILGTQCHETADMIINALELPISHEDFLDECSKQYEKLFPNVQLMPGAQKLVKHLHKNSIPIALATSSNNKGVEMKMRNYQNILKLFHHCVMGSSDPEVKRGKPDPSIFLVCASRFPEKPKPENCLVFEDAVNGMIAAKAANMQVVVVPDPRVERDQLKDATLILNSLEDFKPEAFGLPPFDS